MYWCETGLDQPIFNKSNIFWNSANLLPQPFHNSKLLQSFLLLLKSSTPRLTKYEAIWQGRRIQHCAGVQPVQTSPFLIKEYFSVLCKHSSSPISSYQIVAFFSASTKELHVRLTEQGALWQRRRLQRWAGVQQVQTSPFLIKEYFA